MTAALAKLLEPDIVKRSALRKKLSEIYDIRSKLVHGNLREIKDIRKVSTASTNAIDIAVKALRISYKKGRDWLSLKSEERSNQILLEWP